MGGSKDSGGSGEEASQTKQSLQLSMLTRAGGTRMSPAGDTTGTGGGLSSTLRSGSGLLDSPSVSPLKMPQFLDLTVDTTMAVELGAEDLKRALFSSDGGGSSASPTLVEKEKENEGEHADKKVKLFSYPSQFGPSSLPSNLGPSGIFADAARDVGGDSVDENFEKRGDRPRKPNDKLQDRPQDGSSSSLGDDRELHQDEDKRAKRGRTTCPTH